MWSVIQLEFNYNVQQCNQKRNGPSWRIEYILLVTEILREWHEWRWQSIN